MILKPPLKRTTACEKQKTRKRFRRRAGIKILPLWTELSEGICLMMAVAVFNIKKLLSWLVYFFVLIFNIYLEVGSEISEEQLNQTDWVFQSEGQIQLLKFRLIRFRSVGSKL
jgi:hypothetical protein